MVYWKVKVYRVALYLLNILGKGDNCLHISVPQVGSGFKPPSPLLFAPLWKNQSKTWGEQVHPLVLNYVCWGEWEHLNPLKQILPCVLVPQFITTGSSSRCSIARPTIRDGNITWWDSWMLLTAGAEWDASILRPVDSGGGVYRCQISSPFFPLFYSCTHLTHCNIHFPSSHLSRNILVEQV